MKKLLKWELVLLLPLLVACGPQRTETLNKADTVSIATNQSSQASTTQEETTSQETTSTQEETTFVTNAIAKEAIFEIESKKNVLLDDKYTIIVEDQTEDAVLMTIRLDNNGESTLYGMFRYTKSTGILEEMDQVTGEYKPL